MNRSARVPIPFLLGLVAAFVLSPTARAEDRMPRVLFLTHSAGYVHEVVKRKAPGELALAERRLVEAAAGRFDVDATQDCDTITAENLARYDAVVFYTTGALPIEAAHRKALIDWVRDGGAFVGVHPATDTMYKFADYGGMVGGYFDGHPWHETVRIKVEDARHPATAHLGDVFEIKDEIYQFRSWKRSDLHVLLGLDVTSVDVAKKGVKRADRDFAISWCKAFDRGRVFYTALGHRAEVWHDDRFLKHVLEGIAWAIRPADHDEEGFVPIFDKSHQAGWHQAGPGKFEIEGGVATSRGGMGLFYYEEPYRNFILRLEFRQNSIAANSGVYVRFPRVDGDPWLPVKEGYEIQIAGDRPAKNTTGSIYSFQAPTRIPLRPAGEWNEYEIACVGQQYTVRLNGEVINVFEGTRARRGMIGVQNHDDASRVSYRNIRVRELPENAAAYHVLFDGAEGTRGWKMAGPGSFAFARGVLTTEGGMGLFWHEQPFEDFLLLLDWKVARKEDNSGVFVRFPDPGDDPWVAVHQGYELQICDPAKPKHRTGSVYSFQDATEVPTHAVGTWNRYEIQVVGQRYLVRVNGKLVNDFKGERSRAGHIGLQNHDPKAKVSYRNIRVVALK